MSREYGGPSSPAAYRSGTMGFERVVSPCPGAVAAQCALTVEGERLIAAAMARIVSPVWRRSAISIRSVSERNRGEITRVVNGSRVARNVYCAVLEAHRVAIAPVVACGATDTDFSAPAARVQPCANSFRNCCRLADCGRRPVPLRTRHDATPTSTDLACVASTARNHPGAGCSTFSRNRQIGRGPRTQGFPGLDLTPG